MLRGAASSGSGCVNLLFWQAVQATPGQHGRNMNTDERRYLATKPPARQALAPPNPRKWLPTTGLHPGRLLSGRLLRRPLSPPLEWLFGAARRSFHPSAHSTQSGSLDSLLVPYLTILSLDFSPPSLPPLTSEHFFLAQSCPTLLHGGHPSSIGFVFSSRPTSRPFHPHGTYPP